MSKASYQRELLTYTVARPAQLPDFRAPPLNEVVLGVQFSPPKNYQQIYAGSVWELFKSEYPNVQELASIPPSFETFGISHQRPAVPQIRFDVGGSHDRFWFLRPAADELIQFQQDRLLHNWRRSDDETNKYPRFESMLGRFHDELIKLQNFVATLSPQTLQINQCEVSYVNHIHTGPGEDFSPSKWLKFMNFSDKGPDDFSMTFREVIRDASGSPQSRLTCETSSGILANGNEVIVINLTVRGAPRGSDIDSALEFLAAGRDVIVNKFAELTTDESHKVWERTQ